VSISSYEFLSIVQAQDEAAVEATAHMDYQSLLESVRASIAQNHADELAAALNDVGATAELKSLILKYTTALLSGQDFDRESLTEKIYQDMAGLGLLTPYLHDPTVEEININGYETVEIIRPSGTTFLYGAEAFASPNAALDVIKRMVRMGGMLLDAQTPRVDSYIGSGTRISAIIPPLVPQEHGVVVSIRKQVKSRLTREQMIEAGTATSDMLDFLATCICYGVSIGVAGGTGSGKSTLLYNISGIDRATSGTVQFLDQRIDRMSEEELSALRLHRMGFVFQDINLQKKPVFAGQYPLPRPDEKPRSQTGTARQSKRIDDADGH